MHIKVLSHKDVLFSTPAYMCINLVSSIVHGAHATINRVHWTVLCNKCVLTLHVHTHIVGAVYKQTELTVQHLNSLDLLELI